MARIYLDSAPLIYLVEEVIPYSSAIETRLAVPDVVQICSELSRLECRVKPLLDNEFALVTAFDSYFADIMAEIVPLSRQVIDQATELRARYGFKTPDAIHLAAAIISASDLFLTHDHRLNRCKEIPIEVIGS
jgi:predicted nucleic acid-binding protein